MNKRTRLLILLSSILVMSMTLLGCKDDERQDIKPVDSKTIHVELTANVVTSVPVTRGFTLDVQHTAAGEMRTPINWNSDIWDNVNNKPIVLAIVRNKSNQTAISDVKKLADTEYEYEPGHGSFSAKIHISATFSQSAAGNEILFYLLDKKDFNSRFNSSEKTLSFNGGASLYDISNPASPVWLKDISDNIFVEPNQRVYFNFIFSGAIDLSNYNGNTSVNKEFDMRPLGTLLMTDFSPRSAGDELNNPAYVSGFRPTLSTNAFDITTKVNLVTASNTNTSTNIANQEVGFETYEATGTSTNAKVSSSEKIGGTSNKLSGVYVKYVLGRSNTGFSISLSNNNIAVFKHNNTATNFANEYASSRVPLNFLMTAGSVKPTTTSSPAGIMANNALSYVAETNVNEAKTGFAVNNANQGVAWLNWTDANALFNNPANTFLNGYHLPSRFELQSIIPYFPVTKLSYVYFDATQQNIQTDDRGGEYTTVEIGKAVLENTKSYYQTVYEAGEGNVTYAVRFVEGTLVKDNKGKSVNTTLSVGNNPYISVWRYSYVDNPYGTGKMVVVYSKVLPATTTFNTSTLELTINGQYEVFKNKSFFAQSNGTPKSNVIYREFPATGWGGNPSGVGSTGYYWSSTSYKNGAYGMYFSSYRAYSGGNPTRHSEKYAVRPFVGNKPTTTTTPINYGNITVNNPLEHVAEHNVNEAKNGFATTNTNEDIALVNWTEANELFNNPSNIFLNGYHLPTRYEWQSIIPYIKPNLDYVYFKSTTSIQIDNRGGEEAKVEIGKAVLQNTKSYYQTVSEGGNEGNVTYAIRFAEGTLVKDNNGQTVNKALNVGNNPYISVWRYSYIDNPHGGGGKMMAVYCKVLPANTTIQTSKTLMINTGSGMVDFKNKNFFAENDGKPKSNVSYREFPASGSRDDSSNKLLGSVGSYWSSTTHNYLPDAFSTHFGSEGSISAHSSRSIQIAVRPFVGKK